MPKYVLKYKFHLCTAKEVDKSVEDRFVIFETFEELLGEYRRLKNALFCEYFNYCTDFKLFSLVSNEIPLSTLDDLLL